MEREYRREGKLQGEADGQWEMKLKKKKHERREKREWMGQMRRGMKGWWGGSRGRSLMVLKSEAGSEEL